MAEKQTSNARITDGEPPDPDYSWGKEARPSTNPTDPIAQEGNGFRLTQVTQDQVLVDFDQGSPHNPNNWSFGKKLYTVLSALSLVLNSGISSSLPSNIVPAMMREFHVTGDSEQVLPTAMFLIGYVVGPLVLSPLSETIGRKPVLLWTFTVFVLATLACALAPDWPAMLIFRFICGTMGAAPQTVVGGVYADMFSTPRIRGRVMTFYMSAASFGPILGPIISGCSAQYGWRWTFRIDLILTVCSWVGALLLPETFGRVILRKQAMKWNKQSASDIYVSQRDVHSVTVKSSRMENLTRPITMLLFEPIILFSAIYISLAYSLIFFCFQAYPIIFEDTYGFSVKETSLCYIPSRIFILYSPPSLPSRDDRLTCAVGIGAVSSGFFSLYYDIIYERAKAQGRRWTQVPEFQRLPLACVGGPCLTISLFWLAWAARPQISWVVPVLSGLLFGFGYQIIFISLLTYVTDAYRIYSASALSASLILRSILGALFPLAADPMYASLGVGWGTSVLGFASVACLPIPLVFLYAGGWIRKKSPFCQRLLRAEGGGAKEGQPEGEGV
ncbi:MFS general substrate transporter [Aspergillus heteromorphus CBS 117.55]|uniref:MFS general substrate transporter n=1 Tax=Aspergillus heteromorphus CBS 117.55 TaxID=1448321 RepID=A0A317UYL3_9EURO|nr:MFS general substrate transporter [Aspergillus heteromorphus CBS 117.55]PWY67154.1 MFS general substrate transporter [Aspergillus heteromorphus CBS 117.55]